MTDLENVVEHLYDCLAASKPENMWVFVRKGIVGDAIALLKKQEAKPVKITKNAYNHKFYYCPNCGRGFEDTYYKRPLYCDKCGQKVKWDDV